jgi:hypothetical protein
VHTPFSVQKIISAIHIINITSITIQVTTKNNGLLKYHTYNFIPRKEYNVDRITEQG